MKNNRIFLQYLMAGLAAIILSHPAHALTEPQKGKADARVKTLTYRDNDVFELQGHYGFTTLIEFSPKERIETASIGDSEAWQVHPSDQRGNVLFIKPLEPNADTNMTVLTDKRIYAFEMTAGMANSSRSDDLAFRVRFIYPDEESTSAKARKPEKYDPLQGQNTSDWNFDYAYSGDKELRPIRAFDDGTFTYLEFSKQDTMPAVFSVDSKGKESLVNFNVQGTYLIIERVGKQFTLRDGDIATCIFNEAYQGKSGKQTQKAKIADNAKTQPDKQARVIPAKEPSSYGPEIKDDHINIPEVKSAWDTLGARPVLTKDLNP
jgi:type IV secretion system protein VirB9